MKEKIWNRCGILPYHQGLVFGGELLTHANGQEFLYDLGIRQNSVVRLAIVPRSGPLALSPRTAITFSSHAILTSSRNNDG